MNGLKEYGRHGAEAVRHMRKYLKELICEQANLHHRLRTDRKEARRFRWIGLTGVEGTLVLSLLLLLGSVGFMLTFGDGWQYLLPSGLLCLLSGAAFLHETGLRRKSAMLIQARREEAWRATEIAAVCAIALRVWLAHADELQRGRFFDAIYEARRRFRPVGGRNKQVVSDAFCFVSAMFEQIQAQNVALMEYSEEIAWLKLHPAGCTAVSLKALFRELDKLLC